MRADRFKCTKLINAHSPFASALGGCSAAEKGIAAGGSRIVTLHQFSSCESCRGIVKGACKGDPSRNQRYESLMATASKLVRFGLPVDEWGCYKAAMSEKAHGLFRNAATGDIFAYSEREDESLKLKEDFKEALKAASGHVWPLQNRSRRDAACDAAVPAFRFNPALDAPSHNGGKRCTLVVVTALLGNAGDSLDAHDDQMQRLFDFERKIGLSSCWFAFVDEGAAKRHLAVKRGLVSTHAPKRSDYGGEIHRFGVWTMVILSKEMMPFGDSERGKNSRIPKMLGHRAFRAAKYMLYADAKLRFKNIENPWLLLHRGLVVPKASWVSPRHPYRSSAFEEAHCVHLLGLAPDAVLDQMRSYEEAGLTSAVGLVEGEWHLRDLRDARSGRLGCDWFNEFVKWGHERDQISFPFVLWNIRRQEITPLFFRFAPRTSTAALVSHMKRTPVAGAKERPHSSLCDIKPESRR